MAGLDRPDCGRVLSGGRGVAALCRYIIRPALANERVQANAAGQVVPKFKTAWRDGIALLLRRHPGSWSG
jgi:hypothetical protein